MRIALFADIHANREAFDACLADAHRNGAERYVFLGDLVGYGADPAYIVDRVAELAMAGADVVRGNHDAAIDTPDPHMNAAARAAIDWTRSRLDTAQRAFLADLPMTITDANRLFVHAEASAPNFWIYVTNIRDAERSLRATNVPVTFCGHVHRPQLYYQSTPKNAQCFIPTSGIAIPLSGARKWLAVLGAVGQPRDENPAAAYAVFDTACSALTFCRVAYDIETAVQKIERAGLPEILGARLFIGR
jgi:diadenosine tetraphosphatase ApaH/serine/threonine PP2A family protein phosphatase